MEGVLLVSVLCVCKLFTWIHSRPIIQKVKQVATTE